MGRKRETLHSACTRQFDTRLDKGGWTSRVVSPPALVLSGVSNKINDLIASLHNNRLSIIILIPPPLSFVFCAGWVFGIADGRHGIMRYKGKKDLLHGPGGEKCSPNIVFLMKLRILMIGSSSN